MNLVQFDDLTQRHTGRALALQAAARPDATCILTEHARYSFGEANARVNALAAGLRGLGLARGERVAFCMDSAPEVIFLALAVNKLGAVWVPVNTDYKGAWLQDTIERSRPRLVVTDAKHAVRVAEVRDGLGCGEFAVLGDAAALPGARAFESLYVHGAPEPDMSGLRHADVSAVLWTSGTTGRSKGVMQCHNVWFQAVESGNRAYGVQPDDVIYSVLPLYNTAAWVTSVFRALFAGIPLALDPAFSVTHFWERVDRYRATQSFTLGAMHMYLWNAPPRADDARHTLRKLQAIPMPADVVKPFSERFGLELLPQGLGQSEAMMLVVNPAPDGRIAPPGSCGKPAALLDARLVGEEGEDVADGEPGELWVRPKAPHIIFSGYFEDPEATAAAWAGEWYRTGDMLKRDAEGWLYFSDRKKDAVRLKGRNISTFEVELVARRHPAIADCAAFGVPSEVLAAESDLKLDVVLKPGHALAAEELAHYINANAPYFFVPRFIEFLEALPYTPTNKVQKYRLRERGVGPAAWDANRAGFRAER
jgi:crotonobetaine/carnitine-CoA ligase